MLVQEGHSAHQISRNLEVQYKTAWFLCHRIREAMRDDGTFDMVGGANEVVEADETYIGGKAKNRAHREPKPKKAVLSLVERDGRVRSFHVPSVTGDNVKPIIAKNADKASALMTDGERRLCEDWCDLRESSDRESRRRRKEATLSGLVTGRRLRIKVMELGLLAAGLFTIPDPAELVAGKKPDLRV